MDTVNTPYRKFYEEEIYELHRKRPHSYTMGLRGCHPYLPGNRSQGMLAVDNRLIFEQVLIQLMGYVPLHAHTGGPLGHSFAVDYTLRPDNHNAAQDVRILICSIFDPIMRMDPDRIKELVKYGEPMVPGKKYHCPPGHAHTIINMAAPSSANQPIIEYVSYYINPQ